MWGVENRTWVKNGQHQGVEGEGVRNTSLRRTRRWVRFSELLWIVVNSVGSTRRHLQEILKSRQGWDNEEEREKKMKKLVDEKGIKCCKGYIPRIKKGEQDQQKQKGQQKWKKMEKM